MRNYERYLYTWINLTGLETGPNDAQGESLLDASEGMTCTPPRTGVYFRLALVAVIAVVTVLVFGSGGRAMPWRETQAVSPVCDCLAPSHKNPNTPMSERVAPQVRVPPSPVHPSPSGWDRPIND